MQETNVRGVAGEPARVGTPAPDFELPALISGVKKTLRLSDYRGRNIILAFYPFNWQEISARQLAGFQRLRPRVLAGKGEVVAVTVDSIMNTTSWEREIGPFDFPICADFWPHGDVCRRYGVLQQSGADAGASERAIFVISREGEVVFRKVYARDEEVELEDVLPVLEKL